MDTKGILKVPALDKSIRTEYEFLNWARKFKGLAIAKIFDSAIESGDATRFPSDYTDADEMPESNTGGKKNKKAKKSNNLSMAYLYMEVESGKSTVCLYKACGDDYPNGQEYLDWDLLQNKYAKTDMLSASKLIQELNRLTLKEKGDPIDFFEKIAVIQLRARKIKDNTI